LYEIQPPTPPALLASETRLLKEFDGLVDKLDFAKLAIPSGKKPVFNIEGFSLTPIVSTISGLRSRDNAGYSVRIRDDIRRTYRTVGDGKGKPYLDASRAIGLVYEGALIAVGAAGIDDNNTLTVVQLQDVTDVRKATAGKNFYKTGLHNGISWRETLVTVWEQLGAELGVDAIAIQSNANSRWPKVQKAGGKGYDDVAQLMGYNPDPVTKNWIKPLPTLSRPAYRRG
jgi:hypothetical protein